MKLSVAMIVKNEEKNLMKSLKALKSLDGKLNYEIIVVDTGSTDNTIEVAKSFGAKVYEHKWNNDFAHMRNISLNYCTGDWILVIDADEVMENSEELVRFINSDEVNKYKSATVGIKSFTEYDYIFGVLVRLFRNKEGIRYEGIVHEQVINYEPVTKTSLTFLHYGYSRDDFELMQYKYERNRELLLKQLDKAKGNDRIYPLFQLARTYAMANKKREAFEVLEESYKLTKSRKDGFIDTFVIHFYAQMLFERKDYKNAIKVCEEGVVYSRNNLDYYYMIAISYSEMRKFSEAEKYIKKFIDIRKNRNEIQCDDGSLTESTYNRLHIILKYKAIGEYEKNNYSEFVKTYKEIEDKETKSSLKEAYLYCLAKLNCIEDIFGFFEEQELSDFDIKIMVDIINRIDIEEKTDFSLEFKKNIMALDKRLELYINVVYLNNLANIDYKCIEFNNFFIWKSELINSLIENDILNVNFLRKINVENLELYMGGISRNYSALKKVYEYCELGFLCSDLEELICVTTMEKVMLNIDSIEGDKFTSLVKRAIINRLKLINMIYSEKVLENNKFMNFISEYDRLFVNLKMLMKLYESDKIEYIKGLKKMLKDSLAYKRVIKSFLNEVKDDFISNDMILEKQKLYSIIEEFINLNKLKEAEEIIDSLLEIFIYDERLLSYKGIVSYMNGDNKNALMKLSIANEIGNYKFDNLYNIACILQNENRIEEAKYYYKEALMKCEDEYMKNELIDIINKL